MVTWTDHLAVVVLALILDAVVGDPDCIWRRAPHPAALLGWSIGRIDRLFNRETLSAHGRKIAGAAAIVMLTSIAALLGWAIEHALPRGAGSDILLGLIASVFIAQNSLYRHAARVRDAFTNGGSMRHAAPSA